MDKEEILRASRKENQNKDIFGLEVISKAQRTGGLIAIIVTYVLMAVEVIIFDGDVNYRYFLIVLSAAMGFWIYKAIKLRKKADIFCAILWTLLTTYSAVMVVLNYIG